MELIRSVPARQPLTYGVDEAACVGLLDVATLDEPVREAADGEGTDPATPLAHRQHEAHLLHVHTNLLGNNSLPSGQPLACHPQTNC